MLALSGLVTWILLAGCHEFHACYDKQCDPLDTSRAGSGADGGAPAGGSVSERGGGAGAAENEEPPGGAAGTDEGGAPACPAPTANCDESTFTRCESNLLTDLDNCGACGAHCGGVCVQGKCYPFEAVVKDMDVPAHGGLAFTPTQAFALSNPGFGTDLVSYSSQAGPRTLFTHGADFSSIVSGVDRLYLLGAGVASELSSVPFSGGTVVKDAATAKTAAVLNGVFYGVDASSMPYRRDETSHERVDMPLPVALSENATAILASDDNDVGLVVEADEGFRYYYLRDDSVDKPPSWQLIASFAGSPAQVRVANEALYVDVVLEPASSDMHELRELGFDGSSRVLTRAFGVLNFELGERRVYLSLQGPDFKAALRVVPLDDPSLSIDLEAAAPMASLSLVREAGPAQTTVVYLYFGDARLVGLSRMPAWLE